MGSQQAKPAPQQQENQNQSPLNSPRSPSLPKEKSGRPSLQDINQMKSKSTSRVVSPDKPSKGNSKNQTRSPTGLDNYKQPSKHQLQNDDNEFMPLMNWSSEGETRIKISLVELIVEKRTNPHLIRNNSDYHGNLGWKKKPSNTFLFKLRQEPSYELNLQIDLQGDVMSGNEQVWITLCPLNIPFGRTVKMGQFKCINVYQKMGQEYPSQEQLGPSLKNIDLAIKEEAFSKWGEPIPRNFRSEKDTGSKSKKPRKFDLYKETSRYFNLKDQWMGSTFVEETPNYYRGWIIETDQMDENLREELKKDLANREKFYVEAMYHILH